MVPGFNLQGAIDIYPYVAKKAGVGSNGRPCNYSPVWEAITWFGVYKLHMAA
jgi:hypothetical protein